MEHKEWNELKRKMAIEVITLDLCETMVPCKEGVERAKAALEAGHPKAQEVEYRMGQALIVLEKFGYKI